MSHLIQHCRVHGSSFGFHLFSLSSPRNRGRFRERSSLEHLPDLFEIVMSQLLLLSFPFFSGWRSNGLRWQRKDLIDRRFISQEKALDQCVPGFTQGRQINVQKRGYSIIMIKTQSMTIRDSDQKEIEKDFDHGEVKE